MRYRSLMMSAAAFAAALAVGHAQAATVTVSGQDDLYNANGPAYEGMAPQAVNVTGLTSVTFSVSTGKQVTVDIGSGSYYEDADGVGSNSGEFNTGGNGVSGMTADTSGFLAGVFESGTIGAAPAALSFSAIGGPGVIKTSFGSLSPSLQQSFFVGDGLTGDGSGAIQTFYVPTGATTLYLGIVDACGFSGSPSCYNDNGGSFTVMTQSAVPEPATWAMLLLGLGGAGMAMRSARLRSQAAAA